MPLELKNYFSKIKKSLPGHLWILLAILLVGIFLRTYNFHAWLKFEDDQVRDATLVSQVISGETAWPQIGPTMRKSGVSEDKLFHLGPIYYDFQIISAKLFGNIPTSLAYPDLLFSILTIPLFYYFLRRYFEQNFSLAATGILAISFFAIQYSRFAWNSNSIPFFVLLFLLALHEFLVKKEKVSWGWASVLGISIGVGVQLHAVLIVLFLATTFFVVAFVFLLRKNWQSWNKWLLVFLVALVLNVNQLVTEGKNNFSNEVAFLSFPAVNSHPELSEKILNFSETVSCNFEANTYLLLLTSGTDSLSVGSAGCDFAYLKAFGRGDFSKFLQKPVFWFWIVPRNILSILGYLALGYFFLKEKETTKKSFLGLITLFTVISFFIMLALNSGGFKEFRYFNQVFFVPFVLLGLLLIFLKQKFPKVHLVILLLVFAGLASFNLNSIRLAIKEFQGQKVRDTNPVFLGEAESLANYLGTERQTTIYLTGEKGYFDNFLKPLSYLLKDQKFDIIEVEKDTEIVASRPLFYLAKNAKITDEQTQVTGHNIKETRIIGQSIIYKLKN